MSAPIRPAASATPAPIIATNITATTPKPAKFATNDVKMNRMPSTVSRLWIAIVCGLISKSSSVRIRQAGSGSTTGCDLSS